MKHEQYMQLAIAEAKKAEQAGRTPLGVVIVMNDEVIMAGTSHVSEWLDPAAHGETYCMRVACKKPYQLNSTTLTQVFSASTYQKISQFWENYV
ncbi:MAG: nucleoside deaminase [Candidatus Pacebacteria bacterium]|nr:nucleoside deaminase [Candidatus Paceibacterota bacterium]PIR60477.1 MAG: hypothetical protein COU67_01740 [Candidatus Pacebacteria bacterium CG10_big_fil_rev_8_21_14_0_10_44_54]